MKRLLILGLFLTLQASLAIANTQLKPSDNKDWHTQSNYHQVISTHLNFDLKVDFSSKQLQGFVEHSIAPLAKMPKTLDLDTRDLDIVKIEIQSNGLWEKTTFNLAKLDPIRGKKLSIKIKPNTSKVKIYYNSRPEASGLQWLTPEQTAGKKHPFMFSQSQAIHARSWMPVQDTPAMRVTYNAKITTDKAIRPVMSANNTPERSLDGVYQFNMPQAIPPYLIAIAAGDILHKSLSKQTAIYSEKAYLESAANEFSDTQAMIEAAEKLYGSYRWDQYDLLILPPSFPFGGMENPRLSFITPTVIAGDKSLVNLIAHELAHSWSGNLVTNATWNDLWLNEGFTSYVENRIMEEVFGRKRAVMEQALAKQDLLKDIKKLQEQDRALNVPLEERDPDHAFSSVPYIKGQFFLMFLEEKFGRKIFDAFIRQYFNDHAFKSLDTDTFYQYLLNNLIIKHPNIVSEKEIHEWIYATYLPKSMPSPKSDAFNKVSLYIKSWNQKKIQLSDIPTKNWTIHEWLFFINNLPTNISKKQLAQLDNAYHFTQSTNSEVAHAWLLLSIKQGYDKIESRLEDYLISIGRRKLIVPLYQELVKNKKHYNFAKRVYQIARPGYHPLAQTTIDEIFLKP